MNDDSIATHMYCHMLSVLLTGQKKKKKKKKLKLESRTCSTNVPYFIPLLSLRSQWRCCPWSSFYVVHVMNKFVFVCVVQVHCCNILFYKIDTILNLPPESSLCLPSVLETVVDLVTEETIPWFLLCYLGPNNYSTFQGTRFNCNKESSIWV